MVKENELINALSETKYECYINKINVKMSSVIKVSCIYYRFYLFSTQFLTHASLYSLDSSAQLSTRN